MNFFLEFLRDHMNQLIIIFGIVLLVLIVGNLIKLINHRTFIENAMNYRNKKTVLNTETLEVEETDVAEVTTPDTIRNYEKEFNKTCAWYNVFSQLVPIFPLLGILGTVAGLILELKAQDVTAVFEALDVAMLSTLWGLVFAIILKAVIALGSARIINDVDIMLDDYDKKLNNSIMLGNIVSKK